MKAKEKKQTGPKRDRLTVHLDWKEAVKKALEKKRPQEGEPKPKGR
jgi:hypothetical protein